MQQGGNTCNEDVDGFRSNVKRGSICLSRRESNLTCKALWPRTSSPWGHGCWPVLFTNLQMSVTNLCHYFCIPCKKPHFHGALEMKFKWGESNAATRCGEYIWLSRRRAQGLSCRLAETTRTHASMNKSTPFRRNPALIWQRTVDRLEHLSCEKNIYLFGG